jgi:hypothetical protein
MVGARQISLIKVARAAASRVGVYVPAVDEYVTD